MKKITLLVCCLVYGISFSQDHFAGITTSKRVGILNGNMNPSEFANLNSRFEVQIAALSLNVSNNKIGFSDIVDGEDIEGLLFNGDKSVDFSLDAELALPGVAFNFRGWGFAVTSKGHITANVVNVNSELGDALVNESDILNALPSTINSNGNQRVNATVWGEIGFSAAKKLWEKDRNRINGGVTLKLLFPGSYANMGLSQFNGDITNNGLENKLTNATANLNIAYSGNFGESFSDSSDYTGSLFGNLNGMATDFGVDYQLKNKIGSGYKLKVGASIKNIGSMTFKGEDNVSSTYKLDVNNNPGIDLNDFNDVEGLEDIEEVLESYEALGYYEKTENSKDIKVKLPTVFNLYADLKVISKLSVTFFMQQKMGDNENNDQITAQNSISITPRISLGPFEAFLPIGNNELSGTTAGFGFRLGGFFLGSNSIITAATSDSKQADAYFGFRFGFL
ncbi:hypothetical protein [Flavobacterium soli]|uniref:hypothetical protein n=1 Tax=Flavobacterium soli TaxID=344881 RepID=UPI00041C208D|nr:hypothetical protein [Flavobacterium soli]